MDVLLLLRSHYLMLPRTRIVSLDMLQVGNRMGNREDWISRLWANRSKSDRRCVARLEVVYTTLHQYPRARAR